MDTPLLSVILSVYNKQEYLSESLTSLIEQTFTDTEIICVNDGSTDNSLDVLNNYKKQCDRIRIITTENRGASAARNIGIRNALGKYIIIMDADDTIEKDMHQDMISKAERFEADIVICNFSTVYGNGSKRITRTLDYPYNTLIERDGIEKEIIPYSVCLTNANKFVAAHHTLLLRREMLIDNDILYNESQKKEEDKPFIMNCLNFAQRVVFVEGAYYNYIKRENSLISKYSPRFFNLLNNFKSYKKWFRDIYDFNSDTWLNYFISCYEDCIRFVIIHRKNLSNTKDEIMKIIIHPESKKAFCSLNQGHEQVKQMYMNENYDSIYKYYMKKFFKLRVKIFIRDIIR